MSRLSFVAFFASAVILTLALPARALTYWGDWHITADFSNAQLWGIDPSYYVTIQFADVNGDGKADVCGRGIDGILCALSTGSSFGPVTPWTRSFSDGSGYYGQADHPYYSTIQFEDLDGDGKADVCGRGEAGLYLRDLDRQRFWTSHLMDDVLQRLDGRKLAVSLGVDFYLQL